MIDLALLKDFIATAKFPAALAAAWGDMIVDLEKGTDDHDYEAFQEEADAQYGDHNMSYQEYEFAMGVLDTCYSEVED